MDVVVHNGKCIHCMFGGYINNDLERVDISGHHHIAPLFQNVYFLSSQYILSGIVNMLIDIGVFEFICSQSPYSMKGLLLGTFFSLKSLFQGIAVISMIVLAYQVCELWEWFLPHEYRHMCSGVGFIHICG